MSKSSQPQDPARAAFLEALEKKKNKSGAGNSGITNPDKSDAKKSGPDMARRMFQRRSGSA
ncbi:MAG: hypothetical protein RIS75_1349 [Actinomycetota bacterium]